MQVLPGAPGTARQGRTRSIIVSTYDGGNATQPRAPGHDRPFTASSGAAKHGRLSAATRAPGADVPPATAAGAPGQYCLSAVPAAPDHDRSDARHQRAPGHERPLAALSAARHDRPRATLRAPGADVPLATTAGAPGQRRLRAMATATVALPAGQHRLRQDGLPRVPANPRTLTYPHSHRDTALTRTTYFRATPSPCTAGGPQGGQVMSPTSSLRRKPQSSPRPAARRSADSPSLPGKGPGVRSKPLLSHHTTHQVHLAIQVPPRPRSCSTACTGFSRQRQSRAPPPPAHRKPTYPSPVIPPLHMVERGPGDGLKPHPTPGTIRAALARQRVRHAPNRPRYMPIAARARAGCSSASNGITWA